ncbi:acyl-CoA dehydratase activase-related protein [Caldanaerobius polysaccharolyticus]|uniref:acyl-CoA dehydratase activase-related protein n=1 Tax=Caldanaerobius polysaccharolyticus TaxID=44256 RepID=UPI000B119952
MVIGVPRALLYYNFFPWWKVFLETLGNKVVVSSRTNKAILDAGVKNSVDEACLPVKVMFGHILDLKGKGVDCIFVPRIVSVEKNRYLCAKFLGLPDLVKAMLDDIPPVIEMEVNLYKGEKAFDREVIRLGRMFTKDVHQIKEARDKADRVQREYERLLKETTANDALKILFGAHVSPEKRRYGMRIGLIGHSYDIYDDYINMSIIDRLNDMGCQVITADMLTEEQIAQGASHFKKDMFWTYGRQLLGAGLYFLDEENVDGVIMVTAFGCGPDSLIKELVEREYKRKKTLPLLCLTIDEQSGEAGLQTRLEAFIDLLRLKEAVGR